jgi:hypothetical protein
MNEEEFESRIAEAERLCSRRRAYREGYVHGLRRFYQEPNFGTLQEYEEWLSLDYHRDETKAEMGRGYPDGLQGIRPKR